MLSFFEPISTAINAALESDAANRRYLAELGSVSLIVESTLPTAEVLATISEGIVTLSPTTELESDPSITIRGKSLNLLKLASGALDNPAALRKADIHVEGDVALLLEIAQVMSKIEIDWEGLLAERIGDTPAVLLGRIAAQVKSTAQSFVASQSEALHSKLQEPNTFLPSRGEFTEFKTRLRELQYRVDRFEATLKSTDASSHESP